MVPLGLTDLLAELRTAETPVASTVHEPFGSPAGPGLFHVKGLQLPAYIQHVAHHLVGQGHTESQAIGMAVGIVKNWAAGHDGHGHAVHPDVQAAAAKAVAEWEAAKATAHANSGRSAPMTAQAEYRAQMSAADQNDLPDDAFAYIEPGGSKDSGGKTVPRSLRHFPVHDAAHVRNALSRAPQSPFGEKAMPKIRAAAKKLGVDVSDDSGRSAETASTERRYTSGIIELRATGEGRRIGGYGAVFGKLSKNLGGFVERVDPQAFSESRAAGWPDVVCRFNHDPNMVLGTTGGNTLSLRTDSTGLDYEVVPPQTRQDVVELVERRDIRCSSFAFRVPAGGETWTTTRDTNYPMRTLHEVELVDVSPVLNPAYADATAALRSLAAQMGAPLEEVRAMADADELRRFFVRTDRPSYAPPKPKLSAHEAMLRLAEKRFGPRAD